MKQIFTLLILWLSVWHCNADSQNSPIEQETHHFFSPSSVSPFSKEIKGIDEVSKFSKGELGRISTILAPDIAFVFSAYQESPTLLVAHWQIAEGYYLYRNQFQFVLKGGGVLGEPQFPLGTFKDDIKYGRVEVYEHALEVKLPIQDIQGLTTVTLETTYLGCAEDRMCYPPIQKMTLVDLSHTIPAIDAVTDETMTQKSNTQKDEQYKRELSLNTQDQSLLTKVGDFFGFGNEHESEFLELDKAFAFSAEFSDSTSLLLQWQIAEGYYLYRDKLDFSLQSSGKLGTPQLPPSLLKKDPLFGDVQIYQQPLLKILVPIQTEGVQPVTLSVKYQGCAVAGFCYPPTTKTVNLISPFDKRKQKEISELQNSSLNQEGKFSEQERFFNILTNANVWYTIIVFFGLGLLLSLTPCVYPMIPILSSLIVGQGKQVTTFKAFIMSLTYVLAMAFTYALAGVLTALFGESLPAVFQNPWILVSFALVFVALSLSMFGFYELQMPTALQTKLTLLSNRQSGGTLIGVTIMGILSALIVGPCVAAPLIGALIYISRTGDMLLGGLALFFMSIGMGIPLILIGTSAGHFLPKAEKWMNTIKSIFGVLLLGVAIWMLERVIPGQITMLLWATLLIVSAVYMGVLNSFPDDPEKKVSGWQKLWKGFSVIFLVYGILLMIGAASGHVNPLQPLHNFGVSSNTVTQSNAEVSSFKLIKGVNGLEHELTLAQAQNKLVMLDFYADWCISCKEMEYFTFTDTQVQKLLAKFVLLKADVTANDEQDKALYKHFEIFGPPAILFFDTNGQEQRTYRVVGFMSAEQFHQHLNEVLQP